MWREGRERGGPRGGGSPSLLCEALLLRWDQAFPLRPCISGSLTRGWAVWAVRGEGRGTSEHPGA